VLDSWVRFEQQVKESEQADLTKSVIDKVVASLKDDKTFWRAELLKLSTLPSKLRSLHQQDVHSSTVLVNIIFDAKSM